MVAQVRQYEFVNVRKSSFAPVRPNQPQLQSEPSQRFTLVAKKSRPVEHGAGHCPGFGLGVQNVPQPEQTGPAQAKAVTATERPSDFEWRSQRQNRPDGPFDLLEHWNPKAHEPAHARILDDRNVRVAEFAREGYFRTCV